MPTKHFQEQFNFPGGDTFENIDFSYAQFWHSSFTNAVFKTNMAFTKAYNCEFKRCIFTFNHAYGATFEKCRFVQCEFVENNTFTNCSLRDVAFENCFMPTRVFFDCSRRTDSVMEKGSCPLGDATLVTTTVPANTPCRPSRPLNRRE